VIPAATKTAAVELDERSLRVLDTAAVALKAWMLSGKLPDVSWMSEQDWAFAEKFFEGSKDDDN
jgi:hypothetical protein